MIGLIKKNEIIGAFGDYIFLLFITYILGIDHKSY